MNLLTVVLTCFIEVFEKSRIFDTLGDDRTLFRVGLFVRDDSFDTEKSEILFHFVSLEKTWNISGRTSLYRATVIRRNKTPLLVPE